MGRWLSRDPLGERGGLNVYGFVGNNSIINVDILGARLFNNPIDFPSFPPINIPTPGLPDLPDFGFGDDFIKPNIQDLNINFKQAFEVQGCAGVGLGVCLTGSAKLKVGDCCNEDGSEGRMGQISGSITAGPATTTSGFNVNQDIASIEVDFGMPTCPTETEPNVDGVITVSTGASLPGGGLGIGAGCSLDSSLSWSCSGSVKGTAGTGGADASIEGGIQVSGKFKIE